ncbi:hypothetical protein GQ53DRAFT_808047, partial [Thozetella sp. PMI_491]
MSLGPQCWRCRKRRVRCDSRQPACKRCLSANSDCPGYGDKKPITWRKPIVVLNHSDAAPLPAQHAAPVGTRTGGDGKAPENAAHTGLMHRSPPTRGVLLQLRMAAEAVSYYNAQVAPDLLPFRTTHSPYLVELQQLGSFSGYFQYAYMSIMAIHRLASTAQASPAPMRGEALQRDDLDALACSLAKGDFRA